MRHWAELLSAIRRPMNKRSFELATFAAARALRSTLCAVAHGRALLEFFSAEDVIAMAGGATPIALTEADAALMRFAGAVALDANAITASDVTELKRLGFSDAEVFDVAAVAAGRAFFTKIIESLGATTDAPVSDLDPALLEALAVGRPIEQSEPERIAELEFRAAG
jgi:alkylhydroperoxidase family enzyme